MVTHTTETKPRSKLCFVVSTPMTAIAFLNGHIDHLGDEFDITVVCNFDGSEPEISQKAKLKNIEITRPISPIADVRALWKLYRFLRQERFGIVHSVTPKAGLLTAVSGWLAQTPIRVHWFTGQVWVLAKGPKRWLLKNLDRLISALDTQVLIDSSSQRDFLMRERVIKLNRSQVLGDGSIAGVDTQRFQPNQEVRVNVRSELGIRSDEIKIILYMGRLNKEKGIDILLSIFEKIESRGDVLLLLIGEDEANYLARFQQGLVRSSPAFKHLPHTRFPERFMAAADIFFLPSLREGFGMTLIEAASSQLPVISSKIYGVIDSVVDGKSGYLVDPQDYMEYFDRLIYLLEHEDARSAMGQFGRRRVLGVWQKERIEKALKDFYSDQISLLKKA